MRHCPQKYFCKEIFEIAINLAVLDSDNGSDGVKWFLLNLASLVQLLRSRQGNVCNKLLE